MIRMIMHTGPLRESTQTGRLCRPLFILLLLVLLPPGMNVVLSGISQTLTRFFHVQARHADHLE